MQCGICRIPFKLEYFSDDNNLIQIYKTKISEQRRNLNCPRCSNTNLIAK